MLTLSNGCYVANGTVWTLGRDWAPVALDGLSDRSAARVRALVAQHAGKLGALAVNERTDVLYVPVLDAGAWHFYALDAHGFRFLGTIGADGVKTYG